MDSRRSAKPCAYSALTALLLASACGEPATLGAAPRERSGGNALRPDAAAHLFDPRIVRHYELTVDAADWDRIQRFPVKEEYVEGSLLFEGQTFAPVALRYKGARGSLYNCFQCCSTSDTQAECPTEACYDADGTIAPSTCAKLSMKIDFGSSFGKVPFFGIDRLNFHAPHADGTLLRERLAYQLFAEFGVTGPRAASATLSVNGTDLGVFTVVEQVDERFARRAFPDGGLGNVYKARWPATSVDPEYFRSGLETNQKQGQVSAIVRFAEELGDASMETIAPLLAARTDLDALVRYLVVDRAIRHFDGPLNFRCKDPATLPPLPADVRDAQLPPLGFEVCQNKNYYLYESTNDGRLTLVPWDLDYTLLEAVVFPDWLAPPPACGMQYEGRPPACDPLVRWLGVVAYGDFWRAGQAFLDGPFRISRMTATLDEWAAHLANPVAKHEGIDPATYAIRVDLLKSTLPALRASFEASLTR